MSTGAQPNPMSPMATRHSVLEDAAESHAAPMTAAIMNTDTVRRGPKRSRAKPTGNCPRAKATNQAAEICPRSAGDRPRSRLRSTATMARKAR